MAVVDDNVWTAIVIPSVGVVLYNFVVFSSYPAVSKAIQSGDIGDLNGNVFKLKLNYTCE